MPLHNLDRGGFGWDQVDPLDSKDTHLWMKLEHLGHYLFAADFLKKSHPRAVADISCGTGYGIAELARAAETVIGVDSSAEMIEIASNRCKDLNVRFILKDLDDQDLTPDIEEESLDAVVSFETIEHLVDPNRAISQFSRALKPGGLSYALYQTFCQSRAPAPACPGTGVISSYSTSDRSAGWCKATGCRWCTGWASPGLMPCSKESSSFQVPS